LYDSSKMSSVPTDELPPLGEPWLLAIDELETSQRDFLTSCDNFVSQPSEKTMQAAKTGGIATVYGLRDTLNWVFADGSDMEQDEQISVTRTILFNEDIRRASSLHLAAATRSRFFKPKLPESSQTVANAITATVQQAITNEQIVSALTSGYADRLHKDLQQLAELFPHRNSAKLEQLATSVGKLTLEALKLGVRYSPAGWLVNKLG
jgi:hypothetical protein